ncbi:MAG TPA: OmpH family outer membrane protein [Brevundimonas sp.]
MKLFALTAFAAAALVASTASAQTQPASNPGPVIPGMCVLNLEGVLGISVPGQAMAARMRELRAEVNGEVGPYYQAVQTGLNTLQQGAAAMSQQDRDQQSQLLRQRYEEAQQLEQTREQELAYTGQEQLKVMAAAAKPIIEAVYAERGCGMLLSSDTVINMNPAMDISETVLQRVNAQIQPNRTFARMAVPVQQPQQQAQ